MSIISIDTDSFSIDNSGNRNLNMYQTNSVDWCREKRRYFLAQGKAARGKVARGKVAQGKVAQGKVARGEAAQEKVALRAKARPTIPFPSMERRRRDWMRSKVSPQHN